MQYSIDKAGQVYPTRKIQASHEAAINRAAEILRRGGLVVFPTETVYGLGADACNPIAVARIFEVKRRPAIDPLIIHVADAESARLYGEIPDAWAPLLMKKFWPGPLTLVVRKRSIIPSIVTAGLDTVAIRVPAHPVAQALIRASHTAIAAPSANPFGYVSPTKAEHIQGELFDQIDLLLDGGPCDVGLESTIVSLVETSPLILRAGGITDEEIAQALCLASVPVSAKSHAVPQAPGQLARHYATRTPLEIVSDNDWEAFLGSGEKVGLLTLKPPSTPGRFASVEVLSETGDFREAAANLFAALRRLDALGLDRILASPIPEKGLGVAIMDRLHRCAARNA
jgi:L-threonylcarbamoyladenylate synthase